MTQAKRTARFTRSRQDYDLFKVTLPHYDPKVMSGIFLHLSPTQYLKPNMPFATIYLHSKPLQRQVLKETEQLIEPQQLTTTMTGCVQRMGSRFRESEKGWQLEGEVLKGNLQLMWFRQCQHFMQNQSITNSNITNPIFPSRLQQCNRCGKEIYIYLSNQEQTITVQDFIKFNAGIEQEQLPHLEWTIILNQQFTPTTKIAKIGDQELSYPVLAKPTYLLPQGERSTSSQPLLKIRRIFCRHQQELQGRCQLCLTQIDVSEMPSFHRYLFQYGPKGTKKALLKGAALIKQEDQYLENLLSNNKLILILDLDNTILHSTQMSELDFFQVLKLKEFFAIPKIQQISSQQRPRLDYIIVKLRPYLKEFLYIINNLFQIYVYTKGTRIYATEICRMIRQQWAGQKPANSQTIAWPEPPLTFLSKNECFKPYRLISRNEDNNLQTKSMQNILPNRKSFHVIVDDRRDVWNNSPSWFYTRDYYYFLRKSKNTSEQEIGHFLNEQETSPLKDKLHEAYNRMRQDCPKKKEVQMQFSKKADYFLAFAARALKKIHNSYFNSYYKIRSESPQVKLPNVQISELLVKQRLFLLKKKIRFFMAPGDEGMTIFRRALRMGASNWLYDEPDKSPDFIIRGSSYIKFVQEWRDSKFKLNKEEELPIVSNSEQKVQMKQAEGLESDNSNIKDESMKNQTKKEETRKDETRKQGEKIIDYEYEIRILEEMVQRKIPIISEVWISACYQFSFPFNYNDFVLANPFEAEVDYSQFTDAINKMGKRVLRDIQDKIEKELKEETFEGKGRGSDKV